MNEILHYKNFVSFYCNVILNHIITQRHNNLMLIYYPIKKNSHSTPEISLDL